jgi:hypothetical protein
MPRRSRAAGVVIGVVVAVVIGVIAWMGVDSLQEASSTVDGRAEIIDEPRCRFVRGSGDNDPGHEECRATVRNGDSRAAVSVSTSARRGDVIAVRIDPDTRRITGAGTVGNARLAGYVALGLAGLFLVFALAIAFTSRRKRRAAG